MTPLSPLTGTAPASERAKFFYGMAWACFAIRITESVASVLGWHERDFASSADITALGCFFLLLALWHRAVRVRPYDPDVARAVRLEDGE